MWNDTSAAKIAGAKYPIFQGPFGGNLSTVQLTATVSNMGGIGGYGAYSMTPDQIVTIDKETRAATNGPYNINLWVWDTDTPPDGISDEQFDKARTLFQPYFDELSLDFPQKPPPQPSRFDNQVQVILDIRPPVFSFMFGIPSAAILKECRKKHIVTAGGTAFLACEESGAPPFHRHLLFSESAKYSVLTRAFTGRLGRGLANRIAKEFSGKEKDFLPFPLQSKLTGSLRQTAIDRQKWDLLLAWGGQIATVLTHTKTADLMNALITDTENYYNKLH